MPRKVSCGIWSLALILGLAVAAFAEMGSTHYRIPTAVLSSGGIMMNSASYQMTTTLGQSSCIGQSSKGSYINYAGFWQPTEFKIRGEAMPWIPLLLLDD